MIDRVSQNERRNTRCGNPLMPSSATSLYIGTTPKTPEVSIHSADEENGCRAAKGHVG